VNLGPAAGVLSAGPLPDGSLRAAKSDRLLAIATAVGFGIVCRLSQYAADTSVWHDEAFVALNVLQKSIAGLLGPLDWHEASPPGFLILEKLVVTWVGRSEYALRLVPLLAGVAGLIGFAVVARRLCGARAALWAVALMASSDKLIAQANAAKHFTLDVLCAVLLTWLAMRILRKTRPTASFLMWGALGAVCPWVSFASVFVFAATSVMLAACAARDWRWTERGLYGMANLWALWSVALLLVPIHAQLSVPMLDFWHDAFPDTQSLSALVYWLGRAVLGFSNYFWQPLGLLLLGLAAFGFVRWWRTGRRIELGMLALPVLFALAASCARRWPFGGNPHMVFAAPAVFVLVGEGIEALRERAIGRLHTVGIVALVLLFMPGVLTAAYRIAAPRQRHEVRPVIEFVQRHSEPGDQLLVFCPAEVEFYTGRDFRNAPAKSDPSTRVWYIATRSGERPFPAQEVLDRLNARRPRLEAIEEFGAAAYLFGPERASSAATTPSRGRMDTR